MNQQYDSYCQNNRVASGPTTCNEEKIRGNFADNSFDDSREDHQKPTATASDDEILGSSANNFDELRNDYQNAIDCLVQCESIIQALQDQLATKDEKIKSLESKIVEMSLELASSKSLEDELQHKLKRRMTKLGPSPSPMPSSSLNSSDHSLKKTIKTGSLQPFLEADIPPNADLEPRKSLLFLNRSWSYRNRSKPLRSHSNGALHASAPCAFVNTNDRRSSAIEANRLDDSSTSSSRRLSGLGQLLGFSRSDTPETTRKSTKGYTVENLEETRNVDDISWRLRRPQQKKINLQSSSVPAISGVLFPVSTDDCLLDLDCFTEESSKRQSTRANEDWPLF